MKFLEKNKKWFFLLSAVCFAICLMSTLFNGIRYLLTSFSSYAAIGMSWSGILQTAMNFGDILLGALLIIVLLVTAIVCWRKGKANIFLAGSGAVMLLCWGFAMIIHIVRFLMERSGAVMVTSSVEDNIWMLIFSAYLIVFPFLKSKGITVPVLGITLIVLMFGGSMISSLGRLQYYGLRSYFGWQGILNLLGDIVNMIMSSVQYLGLLLLVPLALYTPKNVAEPMDAANEDNSHTEIPVEENN